jgi:hypothetical protein
MKNHIISIKAYEDTWRAVDILVDSNLMGFMIKNDKFYNISDQQLKVLNDNKLIYKILQSYDGLEEDGDKTM